MSKVAARPQKASASASNGATSLRSAKRQRTGHYPSQISEIEQMGTAKALHDMLLWLQGEHGCDIDAFRVDIREDSDTGYRGLFAKADIVAFERLLRIPAAALLNERTLRKHYNDASYESLSSIQIVTLHVARWRQGLESSPWAPFLATLPRDYPTIPLRQRKEAEWHKMLSLVPDGLATCLQAVETRFDKDWEVVSGFDDRILADVFVWAWLSFNSRCVSYPLGHRDSNENATFAPIIDMANHGLKELTKPCVHHNGNLDLESCPFTSAQRPNEILNKEGGEILSTYGPHDNATLLAEYGFSLDSNHHDSICVDRTFWTLFEDRLGDQAVSRRELLTRYSYEGEYTLSCTKPPLPSFRLQAALALMTSNDLVGWQRMITGTCVDDFDSNESVQTELDHLVRLVRQIAIQQDAALAALDVVGLNGIKNMIRSLWQPYIDLPVL